jgi:hypothetical protein
LLLLLLLQQQLLSLIQSKSVTTTGTSTTGIVVHEDTTIQPQQRQGPVFIGLVNYNNDDNSNDKQKDHDDDINNDVTVSSTTLKTTLSNKTTGTSIRNLSTNSNSQFPPLPIRIHCGGGTYLDYQYVTVPSTNNNTIRTQIRIIWRGGTSFLLDSLKEEKMFVNYIRPTPFTIIVPSLSSSTNNTSPSSSIVNTDGSYNYYAPKLVYYVHKFVRYDQTIPLQYNIPVESSIESSSSSSSSSSTPTLYYTVRLHFAETVCCGLLLISCSYVS